MLPHMGGSHLPTATTVFPLLLLLLSFSFSFPRPVSSTPHTNALSFSFPSFDAATPLHLYGSAQLDSAGAVRMSPSSSAPNNASSAPAGGLLMYARPLDFGRKPTFSAVFDFSISPHTPNCLAFFVAPAGLVAPADLIKPGGVPPGVFAVEFDTARDVADADINDNHVAVDIGSAVSIRAFNVSAAGMVLASGQRMRAWIDFDGDNGILEIRLNTSSSSSSPPPFQNRPADPFASCHVDLAGLIWQEAMLVGISTTTATAATNSSQPLPQLVTIYSWTFSLARAPPYKMHSEPLDPAQAFADADIAAPKQIPLVVVHQGPGSGGDLYTPTILMALALGAACGAAIALFVVLMCSAKVERHPVVPVDVEYHSAKPTDFGYEKIVVLADLTAPQNDAGATKTLAQTTR